MQKTFDRNTPRVAFERWNARPRDSSDVMSASIISRIKCDSSIESSGLTSKGVWLDVLAVDRQFPSPSDVKMEARGVE